MNLAHVDVTFTGSRIQYFDPHGVPSGGDWALQRDAALFFEGTKNLNVTGCTIERVDGNGLMLSGYTRGAVVAQNEFVWIGDTAMATWGYTKEVDGVQGNDGTDGNQPRGSVFRENLVHENGAYSKQASPFFQAKSAQTTLERNIFFNGPRAGWVERPGFVPGTVQTEHFDSCLTGSTSTMVLVVGTFCNTTWFSTSVEKVQIMVHAVLPSPSLFCTELTSFAPRSVQQLGSVREHINCHAKKCSP